MMEEKMVAGLKAVDSLIKVFPDEEPAGGETIQLSALRGETVSFEVAYLGENWGKTSWKVTAEAPEGFEVRVRAVALVPSAYPCHAQQDDNYLRNKPGLFPDLLRDLESIGENQWTLRDVAGQWRSLWVDVVAGHAACGDAEIVIRFEAEDGRKKQVEACLHVVEATLPRQKLLHTEWFHADCLADYYGVEVFGEEHWRILENFIRLYASRGMNTILTPVVTPALDTAVGGERTTVQLLEIRKDGDNYTFGFDRLLRWIGICRGCGITHFEIAHLFTQWGAKHAPKILAWENGALRQIFGWNTEADSPEYANFLAQYLIALTEFFREEGLQENVFFHISDEPGQEDLDSYQKARELVLPYIKGFKTVDALSDPLFYERGLVELFSPANNHIEPFLEKKIPGLWTYYCTSQWNEVSNRFMAMPSARTRILGVQLYLYEIVGFLHWGFNFYNSQFSVKHINPYAVTDADETFPSGDSFLVYPGEGGVPEESIRLMVMQQAMQDVRALELLESFVGRERVCRLIEESWDEKITFKHYPKDVSWLTGLRARVNAEIERAIEEARA